MLKNVINKIFFNTEFIKFFIFSGTGLLIDLSVFYFLISLHFYIFWSNIISSCLAISFVYATSVKYTFKNRSSHNFKKYTLFMAYYAISLTIFSYLISVIVDVFEIFPLLSKLILVAPSFLTNYFFAARIIRYRWSG